MAFVTNDRCIAFAGLIQAAELVVQLAQTEVNESALQHSVESLFTLGAEGVDDVFGPLTNLELGLQCAQGLFSVSTTHRHKELIRYLVSLSNLSQRLASNSEMMARVSDGLERIEGEKLEEQQRAWYNAVAGLYQTTLSELTPKIMVRGSAGKLEHADQVAQVRSALFAGVRAAYLWHQLGGRRWHLIFARKGYAECAGKLRQHV